MFLRVCPRGQPVALLREQPHRLIDASTHGWRSSVSHKVKAYSHHPMKPAKIAFLVLIALSVLALAFSIGYQIGRRYTDRERLALSLDMNCSLYQKAESGDLAGVKSQLGFFIYGQFNTYQQHFGPERFVHYDDARRIAAIAATNGDVISLKQ